MHEMVKRMRTISERGLPDHRPKLLRVRKAMNKWRRNGHNEQKAPKINWEVLHDEGMREE